MFGWVIVTMIVTLPYLLLTSYDGMANPKPTDIQVSLRLKNAKTNLTVSVKVSTSAPAENKNNLNCGNHTRSGKPEGNNNFVVFYKNVTTMV
jgi:hypothetical protein